MSDTRKWQVSHTEKRLRIKASRAQTQEKEVNLTRDKYESEDAESKERLKLEYFTLDREDRASQQEDQLANRKDREAERTERSQMMHAKRKERNEMLNILLKLVTKDRASRY